MQHKWKAIEDWVQSLGAQKGQSFTTENDIKFFYHGRSGEPHARPRVKFVRVEEMLETLGHKVSA